MARILAINYIAAIYEQKTAIIWYLSLFIRSEGHILNCMMSGCTHVLYTKYTTLPLMLLAN